jgi:hypothetical protein
MKKISEWLIELPEPQRTLALENFNREDVMVDKLSLALLKAFFWRDTAQKCQYWSELFNKLK